MGATLTVTGDGRFEQLFRVQVAVTGGGLFSQIWLLLWAVRRPALPTRLPSWTMPIVLIIASALAGALTYGARAAAMMVTVRGIESTEAYGQHRMNVQILHIVGSAAPASWWQWPSRSPSTAGDATTARGPMGPSRTRHDGVARGSRVATCLGE